MEGEFLFILVTFWIGYGLVVLEAYQSGEKSCPQPEILS